MTVLSYYAQSWENYNWIVSNCHVPAITQTKIAAEDGINGGAARIMVLMFLCSYVAIYCLADGRMAQGGEEVRWLWPAAVVGSC